MLFKISSSHAVQNFSWLTWKWSFRCSRLYFSHELCHTISAFILSDCHINYICWVLWLVWCWFHNMQSSCYDKTGQRVWHMRKRPRILPDAVSRPSGKCDKGPTELGIIDSSLWTILIEILEDVRIDVSDVRWHACESVWWNHVSRAATLIIVHDIHFERDARHAR